MSHSKGSPTRSEGLVREEPHFGTKLRYRERCIDKESCAFLAQRDGR